MISPDGRLLAVCDGDIVHVKDLMQHPLGRPRQDLSDTKATRVIMTDKCYVVTREGVLSIPDRVRSSSEVSEERAWTGNEGE